MKTSNWFMNIRKILMTPLLIIIALCLCHIFYINYGKNFEHLLRLKKHFAFEENVLYLTLVFSIFYWICLRIINRTMSFLKTTVLLQKHAKIYIIAPLLSRILKVLAVLILFNIYTQQIAIPEDISFYITKLSSILIIGSISFILFKLVDISQGLLLQHYAAEINGIYTERKIFTQTTIIRRILYTLITVLTLGAILTLFDSVRTLGASVLTTAGIAGLVFTFAAQQSLTSIFSGLEIALTQPIKIGDAVVIEKEFGNIEEINFRSVVVKLWDGRRLVIPTSFFLEKPFHNLSKEAENNLIGELHLHVDFTLPVKLLRTQFELILETSPLWDRQVGILQVGDLQERVMQIKILASAENPNNLNDLLAFLREEIISYIVQHYPYALPKTRNYSLKEDYTIDTAFALKNTEFESA